MKKISFNIPYKLKNLKKFDNFKTYAGNGIWTKKIQNRLSKKFCLQIAVPQHLKLLLCR